MFEALAASELMPGLRAVDFAPMVEELSELDLTAGEELLGRDDASDRLFVVLKGRLEVSVETEHGHQILATVEPGGVFGEIGMLAGGSRSAAVRALTDARVATLTAAGLEQLVAAHPVQGEALAQRATERLRRTQVIEHVSTSFGVIDPEALAEVEQLVDWVTVPAGARLFREGDPGDAAYVVAAGRLRAFRQVGGVEVEIGEVGRGELVGEMSLVDGEPRTASVYAVRDTQLIRFSRDAYESLLTRYPRVGLEVARIALRRTRSAPDLDRTRQLSVVVVPVSTGDRRPRLRGRADRSPRPRGPHGEQPPGSTRTSPARASPRSATTTSARCASRTTSKASRRPTATSSTRSTTAGRPGAVGPCAGPTTSCWWPTPRPTPSPVSSSRSCGSWSPIATTRR